MLENIIFRVGDAILGTNVKKQLETHRRYTYLTEQELHELQSKKLNNILLHATTTCHGYSSFKSNLPAEEWIKEFPVLSKRALNSNIDSYISCSFDKNRLIESNSSGSTGQRSTVYLDKTEQSVTRAITILWWEWNDYYLGQPIMQTGITPVRGLVKRIKDILLQTVYVNAFVSTEEEMIKTLTDFGKRKNPILFGYASSLYLLALTAEKNKINVSFEIAMSQGDKLFEHYKSKIESIFQCKVVEDYGLSEGFMIGQKKDLPYFYIYTPSVFIEILDDNGNEVPDGEMGRIVATKLDGYAMPLIRYDTGDLGVKLPQNKYPHKRDLAFPLLEKVIGRNTDIVKTSDGKCLIVHTFTGIFEHFKEIEQFQVQQDVLDELIIRYIPAANFQQFVTQQVEDAIYRETKSNFKYKWEEVDEIRPSNSGKPEIIINNLVSKEIVTISAKKTERYDKNN